LVVDDSCTDESDLTTGTGPGTVNGTADTSGNFSGAAIVFRGGAREDRTSVEKIRVLVAVQAIIGNLEHCTDIFE
jgi:hypothetical protein